MKKYIKAVLYCLALVILLILLYILLTFPPIISGMAAKTMCFCVYVMGRTPESVVQKELLIPNQSRVVSRAARSAAGS